MTRKLGMGMGIAVALTVAGQARANPPYEAASQKICVLPDGTRVLENKGYCPPQTAQRITTINGVVATQAAETGNNDPFWLAFVNNGVVEIDRWVKAGTWAAKVNSGLSAPKEYQLGELDLNGDGKLDLVWVDVGKPALFVYYDITGKGPFVAPAATITLPGTVDLTLSDTNPNGLVVSWSGGSTEITGDAKKLPTKIP